MQQAYPAPGGHHNANSSSSPASTAATGTAITNKTIQLNGGRFDFDDGGSYCGGWEDGKAHGHGVCTGPKGQGAYCGSWHYGFEVSGVYTWPSASTYEGQWQNGKRHGLGVENRGRWIYRGEWTQGFKGRYGVRQSNTSNAKYEGTWANGLQDGYGSETYADGGTYQGQWLRGMRHGYGVRTSARFDVASRYRPKHGLKGSLTSLRSNEVSGPASVNAGVEAAIATAERDRRIDDSRGGFVLKARSDEPPQRRRSLVEKSLKKSILLGLKMRKQRSTSDLEKRVTSGGSIRSTASSTSWMSTESSQSGPNGGSFHTDSNASFVVEDEHPDANVTETYRGEWKNDKRSGFGISERTDGLRYEGEWFNNKKYGYGVTIHRDGSREEGKYKNNVLITSQKKKHIFLIRSAKFRERIDAAVNAAQRASKIAMQKEDIAISRMATARGRAEMSDASAYQAREDSEIAKMTAKQFAPDFTQPDKNCEYKPSWEDKFLKPHFMGPAETVQVAGNPQNQSNNTNPPLVPRGQTLQPFQHRQSLSQFQPKSLYAQKDLSRIITRSGSSGHSQLPVQATAASGAAVTAASHNFSSSTPVHEQYKNSNIIHNQYQTQTEQMHSQMQPGYRGHISHYSDQSAQQPEHYPDSNSRLSRDASINHMSSTTHSQPPYPHLLQHRPSNTQYQSQGRCTSTNSSQSPYMNSVSLSKDSINGYRVSADYIQQQLNSKNAYTNCMNATGDLGESYQRNGSGLQRNSRLVSGESPYSFKQAMSDHFDHYTRPPSRDNSVDRYTRAASRLSGNSRQPSVDRNKLPAESIPGDPHSRAGSVIRGSTPASTTGNGLISGPSIGGPVMNRVTLGSSAMTQPPFEDFILRKRSLGQEIVPSPIGQPKRTESLYIAPSSKKESQNKNTSLAVLIQRKKSMPDFQELPAVASPGMSREEVSVLSSARREEVRRLQEQDERLRANPLLYLVSPQVKEWFSRQQLVMLVLFVNISLAIVFFKLLTS